MSLKNQKIAILLGGYNSERDVSLASGNAVYDSLVNAGYNAVKIDLSRLAISQIEQEKPNLIFNALHGSPGEDGKIPALLDLMQIPYTHSGLKSSAVCMDKIFTHKICVNTGAKTPNYQVLNQGSLQDNLAKLALIGKPFVLKPIAEGSSVGVEVVLANQEFNLANYQWQYGSQMIVEKYISGQEVQVAVFNVPQKSSPLYKKLFNIFCQSERKKSNNITEAELEQAFSKKKSLAIGAIEVRPKHLFYDYHCKYTPGMTQYIMPAEINSDKYLQLLSIAEKCYEEVECSGLARIDFILNNKDNGDDNFYLLEINTHPGFTATSLVPKIAKYHDIEFIEIIELLLASAQYQI
jgi:D-alanine-D-alanine ligase